MFEGYGKWWKNLRDPSAKKYFAPNIIKSYYEQVWGIGTAMWEAKLSATDTPDPDGDDVSVVDVDDYDDGCATISRRRRLSGNGTVDNAPKSDFYGRLRETSASMMEVIKDSAKAIAAAPEQNTPAGRRLQAGLRLGSGDGGGEDDACLGSLEGSPIITPWSKDIFYIEFTYPLWAAPPLSIGGSIRFTTNLEVNLGGVLCFLDRNSKAALTPYLSFEVAVDVFLQVTRALT